MKKRVLNGWLPTIVIGVTGVLIGIIADLALGAELPVKATYVSIGAFASAIAHRTFR
jgi:hypothetical protein